MEMFLKKRKIKEKDTNDKKTTKILDKSLEKLSINEIVELKVEIDDLISKLDNILETCNIALNS